MASPSSVREVASSRVTGSADRVMSRTDWPVFCETPRLPGGQVAEPASELAQQWLVDAVVGAQRRHLGGGEVAGLRAHRRGDLVPGHDPEGDEDKDGDTEQREPDLDETTADAPRRVVSR